MRQGNVSALATSLTPSGTRRLLRCHTCVTDFAETRETGFVDLRTSEAKGMMALKMLLVRVDLAGIGCGLGVTEATVLAWLPRAAHQAAMLNHHLLRARPVTQGQRDEMWHCIARSTLGRRPRPAQACPTARTGGKGAGAAVLPRCG